MHRRFVQMCNQSDNGAWCALSAPHQNAVKVTHMGGAEKALRHSPPWSYRPLREMQNYSSIIPRIQFTQPATVEERRKYVLSAPT